MIRADSISIDRAGRRIIEGFSLVIEPGNITALLGPNGSGKSTVVSALAGDLPVMAGEISIDDHLIGEFSIVALAKVRAVSQQQQRFSLAFTVAEILQMAIHSTGDSASISTSVNALNIANLLDRKVTSLSGGEQARVSIAMALAQETPYILLDEPFAAQDLESAARITSHLQVLAKKGRGILIVAHMHESELAWCDQLLRMPGTRP